MAFLVTVNADTARESVREVADLETLLGFVDAALTRPHFVPDGSTILIRRADYLDRTQKDSVVSERPKLTLIRGGK